jgi:hypothetical protein
MLLESHHTDLSTDMWSVGTCWWAAIDLNPYSYTIKTHKTHFYIRLKPIKTHQTHINISLKPIKPVKPPGSLLAAWLLHRPIFFKGEGDELNQLRKVRGAYEYILSPSIALYYPISPYITLYYPFITLYYPFITLYHPISPCITLYYPIKPYITPYNPI